jgi:hypothetical protein
MAENDYGFKFNLDEIEPSLTGNYGQGTSDFLYGLGNVAETGLTAAGVLSVFGTGASVAKIGAKATVKELPKLLGITNLKLGATATNNWLKATRFGEFKLEKISKPQLPVTKGSVSRMGDVATKANTKAGIATGDTVLTFGKEKFIIKTADGKINQAGVKAARTAIKAGRTSTLKALLKDATVVGAIGLATVGSGSALMAWANKATSRVVGLNGVEVFDQETADQAMDIIPPELEALIPPQLQQMADMVEIQALSQIGDVQGVLDFQKNFYNYESLNTSNYVDVLDMNATGEAAADNMFWLQTQAAIALQNSDGSFIPQDKSQIVLDINTLNSIYDKHKDVTGGIESQGVGGFFGIGAQATLTDDIKKAQENQYKFFFGNSAYYLADENGDTFRVTSGEYYTAFNEYAKSKGETFDWTSDVNEGAISLLQVEFEKDAASWKTESVAANGPLDEASVVIRKKADQLNKYGIYDMNDVVAGQDGVIRAKNAFGIYKVGDPIIFSEVDAESLGQYIIEYQEMPEARGAWDAALAVDSEAAKKFQAEAEAEVNNNLVTANETIKQWYADNGLRYDPNDAFIQQSAQKYADSGLNADVLQQWRTELGQQKIGVWESKYKGWADKLSTGQFSVKSLGEEYLGQIADIYGVNYDDIDVNDPLMKMIFKEDGTVMSVQEAERAIKARPSYEYTKAAAKDYGAIAVSLASRWGV